MIYYLFNAEDGSFKGSGEDIEPYKNDKAVKITTTPPPSIEDEQPKFTSSGSATVDGVEIHSGSWK